VPDFATIAHQELRRPQRKIQGTIPEPQEDVASLRAAVMGLKEIVEVLAGQRGQATEAAVTWNDLLLLDLINKADIPKEIGSNPIRP
jgi:hypothetical protein